MLRADMTGVVVEWHAPGFSLRQVTGNDGRAYSVLETPGWMQTEKPGQPQLPFASALAVVPPTGEVVLHVQVLERARHPLLNPVMPARTPAPVGNPPTDFEWTWARDEQTYAGAGPYPADVVTLEEAGWMRGRRLVRLTFYPLRFDPAGNVLEVAKQVRVELRFAGQPPDVAQGETMTVGGWPPDDPFVPVLQASVVNPAQVNRFVRRQQVAPAATAAQASAYPPAGTEYLVITHSDFITAVAPLAVHRATIDGLRVFSATVETIYAAYGGMGHAEAIKQYIAGAYHQDQPPSLDYVLLVGDGVRDTQNYSQRLGYSQSFVPPYIVTMNPVWCVGCTPWEAASDNRFATIDSDDNLADVFIGRLPVNTVSQAIAVVNKILAYELNPPRWPWNERVLFFAGNELDAPYHQYSDDVYATLPITYTGRRVYFCTSGCNQPHLYPTMAAAHDATVQELNSGGLLASYVGHSSWHQWAVDPQTYAPMFHLNDVASLHNGGALPVVLAMTCYTSDFSDPAGDTLDETLLRRTGGGAVATWGPTTLGLSLGHNVLHQEFFDAVFKEDITELGAATEEAKLALFALGNPYYLDLLNTFILFGDPAMDLNLNIVPWTHEVFLPAMLRNK